MDLGMHKATISIRQNHIESEDVYTTIFPTLLSGYTWKRISNLRLNHPIFKWIHAPFYNTRNLTCATNHNATWMHFKKLDSCVPPFWSILCVYPHCIWLGPFLVSENTRVVNHMYVSSNTIAVVENPTSVGSNPTSLILELPMSHVYFPLPHSDQ